MRTPAFALRPWDWFLMMAGMSHAVAGGHRICIAWHVFSTMTEPALASDLTPHNAPTCVSSSPQAHATATLISAAIEEDADTATIVVGRDEIQHAVAGEIDRD